MEKFSEILWVDHNTEMTQALTITRLALNIYFKNFYNKTEYDFPYTIWPSFPYSNLP